MYGKNDPIIIDALVNEIKRLKLDLAVKDSEISHLKKERDSQAQKLNQPTVKEQTDV